MSTRRSLLLTLVAAGAVASLAGAGGIFAGFTDRATGGANSVESAAARHAADLMIGTFNGESCGDFADDTETGLFTYTKVMPHDALAPITNYCLANVGTETLAITLSAIDYADVDVECTGDEAAFDTTCGGDQQGELGDALQLVVFIDRDCDGTIEETAANGNPQGFDGVLGDLEPDAQALMQLDADTQTCLVIHAFYDGASQASQSDQVSWRFAFDGTAPM